MSQFQFKLPNVRRCFIPDPGYYVCDCDLAQADAQVVAWEADDEILKTIFRDPNADLHDQNTQDIFNISPGHPDFKKKRQLAKFGVHLTNYGGRERTCASTLGITVAEASNFQRRWFQIHPNIKDWHRRIEDQLLTNRTITNAFGYRRQYFDRIDRCFTEALAWIPQSTVALVITKAMIASEAFPVLEPLLQVHDSYIVQFPIRKKDEGLRAMYECMHQEIPYEDPLTIPAGAELHSTSWGDVEKVKWPESCNG